MNTWFKNLRRTAGAVGAALLVAAGSASAAGSTTPQRALILRGQELNRLYGNDWTRVSAAEFKTLVGVFGPNVTTTMTPQQARAELARGQGLNQLYGNAWTRVSPAEFKTLIGAIGIDGTTTMTPQQARGELARGQGLNRLAEQYTITAKPVPAVSSDGFDWGDAGIGGAAAFGAMLLAAAGAISLRKRGRLVFHS